MKARKIRKEKSNLQASAKKIDAQKPLFKINTVKANNGILMEQGCIR